MSLSFNQFQRELQQRNIDPKVAFMLTAVYEQVMELGRRVDDCASVMLNMAHTIKSLTELNEQTRAALKRVERGGRPDGIEVFSVGYDEKDNK